MEPVQPAAGPPVRDPSERRRVVTAAARLAAAGPPVRGATIADALATFFAPPGPASGC